MKANTPLLLLSVLCVLLSILKLDLLSKSSNVYEFKYIRPSKTDVIGCMPANFNIGNTLSFVNDNVTCINSGDWNNPNIWSNNQVPDNTDDVTIGSAFSVKIAGACNAKSIKVQGNLLSTVVNGVHQNFTLSTKGIIVESGGLLQIGTSLNRYDAKGVITLTGDGADIDADLFPAAATGMGTKLIGVMRGGQLELHGEDKTSWSQLDATAQFNTSSITMKVPMLNWRAGDQILIASSVRSQDSSERRTISAVSTNKQTFTFASPLKIAHFGKQLTYNNGLSGTSSKSWTIDMKTEVANLTRSISIQGDALSDNNGFGGHVMVMNGGICHVEQTALTKIGQRRKVARYPLHFHQMGNTGQGQYFKNCAINNSYNRAIVVHATNNTIVEDNVAYQIDGSAYFLEDGVETGNAFRRNFGSNIYVPAHVTANNVWETPVPNLLQTFGVVPSDFKNQAVREKAPAVFWITNPDNIFEDNVAAGSEGTGFWYGLPDGATGLSQGNFPNVSPRFIKINIFRGNRAHSVFTGLHIDHSHNMAQTALEIAPYTPTTNGLPGGARATSLIDDFTCYKMRRGVWHRTTPTNEGAYIRLNNLKLADIEGPEMLVSAWHGFVQNSVFVGETENQTFTVPEEGSNNVSAISFYDGWNAVLNCHFENFNTNLHSVFSSFGGAIDRSNDWFTGCTFRAVNYFNDSVNIRSNRLSGAIRDVEGSVKAANGLGGVANSSIVLGHPYLIDRNNFSIIQNNYQGYKSLSALHVAKLDIIDIDNDIANANTSMYSEWDSGHCVHGSMWGSANQFAAIPNIGRTYLLRFLDNVPKTTLLKFLYAENGDKLNLTIEGPQDGINLSEQGIVQAGSISAVRNSTTTAWFWDNVNNQLIARLVASGDTDPADDELNASKAITIKSSATGNTTAKRTYEITQKPYDGIVRGINQNIEAEDYNHGGQFEAYLEMGDNFPSPLKDISLSNQILNSYRLGEIVDVVSKPSYSNNQAIENINTGEYWRYTVTIPPANGNNNLNLRFNAVANITNCNIKIDGEATGNIYELATIPNTMGTYTINNANIPAGKHTITIKFNNPVNSFDFFRIVPKATVLSSPQVLTSSAGLNEAKAPIKLYPNPVKDNMLVTIAVDTYQNVKLQIFDMQGKLINETSHFLNKNFNTIKLDVSLLKSGTYLLNVIKQNDKTEYKKFIKQ